MDRAMPGGQNVSPPLLWGDVPLNVQSFALSVEDLEIKANDNVLWFVIDISKDQREIRERSSGIRDELPKGCLELRNSRGLLGYEGPRLHLDEEPHRLLFRLFALREPSLALGPFTPPDERLDQVQQKTLTEARLELVAARSA
jgi:Raf kinase inhibitor-like YbhB/YbcL family protein